MESLADALWQGGDRVRPIEMFETWLASHPDHEMARRRLTNLRVPAEAVTRSRIRPQLCIVPSHFRML